MSIRSIVNILKIWLHVKIIAFFCNGGVEGEGCKSCVPVHGSLVCTLEKNNFLLELTTFSERGAKVEYFRVDSPEFIPIYL